MAIKPVLSVDVDDAKFKSFLDKFKKYQEALKDQPEIWKKTNEELSDTEQLTTTLTGLFYTQNEILEKNVDAHRKVRGELEKTDRSMVTFGRSTQKVFETIRNTTGFLLKWSTVSSVLGILSGAGGFFGYEALARSAGAVRTTSLGLGAGVSPGALQAARATYSRVGDVDQILNKIADIKGDPAKSGYYASVLGLSPEQIKAKSATDLLPDFLSALGRKYNSFTPGLETTQANAYKLTDLASINSLRYLGSAQKGGELNGLAGVYAYNTKNIGGSLETDRRYQDFMVRLDAAGSKLQTVLIDSLVKLGDPLAHIVTAFTDLAKSALGSKSFEHGLETFANWLERATKWFEKWDAQGPQPDAPVSPRLDKNNLNGLGQHWDYFKQEMLNPTSYNGSDLPSGLLQSIEYTESGGNPNAISRTGAQGAFQFMPGTAKRYGLTNPFDEGQSAQAAQRYMRDLLRMFGGNLEQALAGYNWGEGNVQNDIRRHGSNWKKYLPQETAQYIEKVIAGMHGGRLHVNPGQSVEVNIRNATGGNVVQAGVGLARSTGGGYV